ncbi:MAG: hypothetical protein HYT82_00585 [Candidatus Harrisonbacteria bacterium]|nr:hypothetical protein [Candidatus Harrisonbacteria bacterium]MBI2406148.1 hypothetical protein [Candidatus Harrisonbacteria bacterium]
MRSFKWWIVFGAMAGVFFILCPKPEVKPAPVAPHETIFSAFGEGVKDGIDKSVRENLWKRTE